MREILFRGKPKNEADYEFLKKIYKDNCKDGFIYGSLVVSHGKYYICIMALCQINSLVNNGTTTMFEVIPETVGEYTCLTDKNGKKIFEGDILDCITSDFDGSDKFVRYIIADITNFEAMGFLDFCNELEVIGNIHDTPNC